LNDEFEVLKAQIISHLRAEREQEIAGKFAARLRQGARIRMLVDKPTPPDTEADRQRVFATVNGKPITSGNVEDTIKAVVYTVQNETYKLLKTQLDAMINGALIDQRARKLNVTSSALYDSEVTAKVTGVTEQAAREFYEANKHQIEGAFEQRRNEIARYLEQRNLQAAADAFTAQLRKEADLKIFLTPPEPPVLNVATDDQPSKGSAAAQVTIVEFTDYQCPSCAATHPLLEKLMAEYAGKVRLVVRDFPLDSHKDARGAAEAAEAARAQGKYWEFVRLLFENQKALDGASLREYAGRTGLDLARFDADIKSPAGRAQVNRDIQEGLMAGVDSTPTIFVNGKRVRQNTYEDLKSAVESALKVAKPARAAK
jgi:protein-disulfide isomerase